MSDANCNYQRIATNEERSQALTEVDCLHCGVSAKELLEKGEKLEVCAEEFASNFGNVNRILTPIALCQNCHEKHHLDAQNEHNPCQISARRSREWL